MEERTGDSGNKIFGGNYMAIRPVFLTLHSSPFCKDEKIDFLYYSGFAEVQRRKSIKSLHEAFLKKNPNGKVLEISSKSEDELGVKLSAFNLELFNKQVKKRVTVESAFQSSKIFERGGPFSDILEVSSLEAKRDNRLRQSGILIAFKYEGDEWSLEPKTLFYDWLYINAVSSNKDLAEEIIKYDAFTDIEFNPDKSINCQARAAALLVSLHRRNLLEKALESKDAYINIIQGVDKPNNAGMCSIPSVESFAVLLFTCITICSPFLSIKIASLPPSRVFLKCVTLQLG
jgi:type I restriction enzyme M protein